MQHYIDKLKPRSLYDFTQNFIYEPLFLPDFTKTYNLNLKKKNADKV